MANSFHRVNQSLRSDRGMRSILVLVTGFLLLGSWITWAFRARVARYETSDSARLEVASEAYPIQATVSGKLISSGMLLGKQVQAGDILAQLENKSERLSLAQERTRLAAIEPELAALRAQTQSEQQGRTDERHVLEIATESARAQYREAEAQAAQAEREADRAARLHAEGILAEADAQRAQAEAKSKRAAAENLRVSIERLEPEQQVRETDRDVRLNQISEEIAKLEADRAASLAEIQRLEYDLDRRFIRAPISGRLADIAVLRAGSLVTEGERLAVIVPSGRLQVIAEFQPSDALGKVRPGQPAVVRLQGFPWAQYGTVSARVSRVAGEIRDGKVRVELAVNSSPHARIPVQHGLPGSVEVEVERVSPATLVLRSAGELVGSR